MDGGAYRRPLSLVRSLANLIENAEANSGRGYTIALGFSTRPRRVWTGLTVPGKKMTSLLEMGGDRLTRGRDLLSLYESAGEALLMTAAAIELLPSRGAKYGPALRDLRAPLQPGTLYGAVLTDIRDFLKLRFRTRGSSAPPNDAPESVVKYSIHVLDQISRDPQGTDWKALGRIRDALTEAGAKLSTQEELEAYAPVFDDLRQLRGQPPQWRE